MGTDRISLLERMLMPSQLQDFSMPSYQKFAVDNWINTYSSYKDQPSKHLYQSNGNARGFPDLSANSFNYTVAIGGVSIGRKNTSLQSFFVHNICC